MKVKRKDLPEAREFVRHVKDELTLRHRWRTKAEPTVRTWVPIGGRRQLMNDLAGNGGSE